MKQINSENDYLLRVENLAHKFGREKVLEGINFTVRAGDAVAIIGASGCGKTTLLRICSGLLENETGTVERTTRNIGYMFQNPRLLPWTSARKNMALALRARRTPLDEAHERVSYMAKFLGLSEDDLEKYPYQLSGGMQSRVAMGRALVIEPDLLLLDEPFTGLDIGLKKELMWALKKESEKKTALLMITHDLSEALELAQEILVLHGKPSAITLRYRIATPVLERKASYINSQLDALLRQEEVASAYNLDLKKL
ncbi:MAG: ATP-binding cassette domain-containing protein [Spirochaetes bacterium]|nr:ATP-binding cassette domain-containing protein [Spirochaetota bacterium]